jgi:dolichyl-phosphate-mannose--protein O-mannosyl transferase
MTFEQRRAWVLSFWILSVTAAGLALGVAIPAGWALIFAIAVIPCIVVMRLWTPPLATVSQKIHAGRR